MKTKHTRDHVNFNSHPSMYPNHVVEKHPTMPSLAKRRFLDCRTGEVKVSDFQSCGNIPIYAVINGLECAVHPYGKSIYNAVKKATEL
jgi:hypothetical protein